MSQSVVGLHKLCEKCEEGFQWEAINGRIGLSKRK